MVIPSWTTLIQKVLSYYIYIFAINDFVLVPLNVVWNRSLMNHRNAKRQATATWTSNLDFDMFKNPRGGRLGVPGPVWGQTVIGLGFLAVLRAGWADYRPISLVLRRDSATFGTKIKLYQIKNKQFGVEAPFDCTPASSRP